MTNLTRLCFSLLLVVAAVVAAKRYDGYGLYRVDNAAQVHKLTSILPGLDWWSKPRGDHPGDVMVARSVRTIFENFLAQKRHRYQVLSNNVQMLIDAETQRQREAEVKPRSHGKITFDRYYRHAEMNAYLDEIAASYPSIAKVQTLGKSFEGREMKAIKLSSGSGKPAVFVDGGIHAREWISPAVALYLLQQMTEGGATDMLDEVDWIILPCLNPDGYEYTHEYDRMWRKTRSIIPNESCVGTDANRNFDFHWMESGASSYPCSDTFAGPEPFSEVEAQNLRSIILENTPQIKAYLTLHSYGQYILYPWGYSDDLPDDWRDLDKLGNEMNDAIEAVRGTSYTVGSSGGVLYAAAGASDDWNKGVAGVKYSYTIELPGGGWQGFDLPPCEIEGVVTETIEGIKVVGRRVAGH